MPRPDALRYRLNRFIKSVSTFISSQMWADNFVREDYPEGVAPIFTVDRTPDWSAATVSAFGKRPDGRIYCDVVASIVRPTQGQLVELCVALNAAHKPAAFGMDSFTLRDLGRELELRGVPVTMAGHADVMNGSALFYAKLQQKQLAHPGHELLAVQIPLTKRKDSDGGFKISRQASSSSIDGVMSHVIGVQLTENHRDNALQMF